MSEDGSVGLLDAGIERADAGFTRDDARESIEFLTNQAIEYGSSVAYVRMLRQVARFRQYKPLNALLAQLQRPGASFVLPPQQWEQQYGRVVKPGQQPIVMLQPFGPVMFVYDVSQTEALRGAPPLPSIVESPFAMRPMRAADAALRWMTENAKADGVRVSYVPAGSQSAGCIRRTWTDEAYQIFDLRGSRAKPPAPALIRYEVEINQTQSTTERLATLAHELGHLYCGHVGTHDEDLWPGRRDIGEHSAEIEAESVAWLLCQRLDETAVLPPYLHQHVEAGRPLPPYDLQRVLTAAGRLVEMVGGWAPRRVRKRPGPAP